MYKLLCFRNITIPLPRQTRKNGTLHIYAFAAPMPRSADETEYWDKSLQSPTTIMAYFQLTQYLVPEAATFNLLKDSDVTISYTYWHTAFFFNVNNIILSLLCCRQRTRKPKKLYNQRKVKKNRLFTSPKN